jgi:hypothetical protein
MKFYVIADWPKLFETAETRKLDHLKWFPSPNKLDGLGYRLMIQERDRAELFAIWNVLKSIASRTSPKERRGYLERGGRPLTAISLAAMSGFPAPLFDRAFTFFSAPEIAWLLVEDRAGSATPPPESDLGSAGRPATAPAFPAATSAEGKGREGTEENGMERGSVGKPPRAAQSDDEWLNSLSADATYKHVNVRELHGKMLRWCEVNGKKPTRRRLVNWLNREEKPMRGAPPSKRSETRLTDKELGELPVFEA